MHTDLHRNFFFSFKSISYMSKNHTTAYFFLKVEWIERKRVYPDTQVKTDNMVQTKWERMRHNAWYIWVRSQ